MVPAQIGELLLAVAVGEAFTVTVVLEVAVHPLFTVTVYVPVIAVVELEMEGDCTVEINPPGPVHA